MEHQDRQAIEGLFAKLDEVARHAGPRDAEAEALIRERMSRQPAAPYLMAQTIVVQEQALEAAQQRIEELERRAASRPAGGGGFFGSMFGGGERQEPARRSHLPGGMGRRGPAAYDDENDHAEAGRRPMGAGPFGQAPRQGGGFLAGAAQTAMGVAGGMMLGSMLGSMFGGGEAKAADASSGSESSGSDTGAETASAENGGEEGGGFFDSLFGGGDFFGGGDEEV